MQPNTSVKFETFISYARVDSEFASKLVEGLRSAGVPVWFDRTDISVGNDWPRAVEEALSTCGRFLIILSPASVGSENVMAELNFALDEGKPVFPVLYKNCKRPFRIRAAQYADLTTDYETGFSDLIKALGLGQMEHLNETRSEQENLSGLKSGSEPGSHEMALNGRARRWRRYAAVITVLSALGGYLGYRTMRYGIPRPTTDQVKINSQVKSPVASDAETASTMPSRSISRDAHLLFEATYTPVPDRKINVAQLARGVDVSQGSGEIPWPEVVAAGYSFAVIRATLGTTSTDQRFSSNWKMAKQAGLIRGAYHVFVPTEGANEQAEAFLKVVQLQPGDLPPVADVERLPFVSGVSNPDLVFRLGQFLGTLQLRTGRAPIIYTPRGFSEENFRALSSLREYPLWIAQYSNGGEPSVPANWSTWTFWQYAGDRHIGAGLFDLNYFNGNKQDLTNFVGLK